jgi:polyhydroxyalkanoate synthesis regulator phasin
MKTKISKLIFVCLMLVAMIGLSMPQHAQSAEIDILVRKLVEKGVLSPGDAQQILNETKEEAKVQLAKGEAPSVPKWVQNVKIKGDLRTRYQWEEKKSGTATKSNDRDRARIRFRLGVDAKVNDQVKLAAGLATGGADPRSTNQTLQDFFQTPDIRLDYAYAQYMPFSWMSLSGGKINNPLWRSSGMLWDSDIYPDGLGLNLKWSAYPKFDTFVNAGFFVLDEDSSYNADPIMWAIQPGFKWGMTDHADLRATFNYYGFNGLKGKKGGYNSASPKTNSKDTDGTYLYSYDSVGASAELGFKKPFGESMPFLVEIGKVPQSFLSLHSF